VSPPSEPPGDGPFAATSVAELVTRLHDLAHATPDRITAGLPHQDAQRLLAALADELRTALLEVCERARELSGQLARGHPLAPLDSTIRVPDEWPEEAAAALAADAGAARALAAFAEAAVPLCGLLLDVQRRLV